MARPPLRFDDVSYPQTLVTAVTVVTSPQTLVQNGVLSRSCADVRRRAPTRADVRTQVVVPMAMLQHLTNLGDADDADDDDDDDDDDDADEEAGSDEGGGGGQSAEEEEEGREEEESKEEEEEEEGAGLEAQAARGVEEAAPGGRWEVES